MELKTARLILRPARTDDLEAMHDVLSNVEATRWWSAPPHATPDQTRIWLDSMIEAPVDASDDFIVERDGRLIGKAGFWRLPEIGYILHPDAWGQGLATEALTAVIDHVFATRGVETLTADVDPENVASIRLLEKLGFEKTGEARATFLIGDQWKDSLYYGLSRLRWTSRHKG